MFPGVALLVPLLGACAPEARPLLAEILYDPAGADPGLEFVELFNPTDRPFPLAGARLEAGDGSAPGRWSVRWTGAASDTVAPRARFLIGGAQVVPAPDAVAALDLQNGPDAVRLAWPDGASEVVGWGAHEFAEYACGEPAVDAASGQSLARIPDDAGFGSNALDFHPAPPTPRRANQAQRDAALLPGALLLAPAQPESGVPALVAGSVTNRGREAIAARTITIVAATRGALGSVTLFDTFLDFGLEPGDTARFEIAAGVLPDGRQTLSCRIGLEGDEAPENDADSLAIRVGPGPLEITEIQFHPASGEGEWIEVRNRSGAAVALEDFTLSDRGSTRGMVRGSGPPCPAESLAVLAQDRTALIARFPSIDSAAVRQVSPWPALNNGNDASGTADAVVLRESDGVPCARVDYSAAGAPPGIPLELQAPGLWGAATEPLGSPLRPPRPLAEIAERFQVAPRRLAGSGAATRLSWSLPWPRARVAAELYALSGARIGVVLPELTAPARADREWRPAGFAPGVYLLVFRARPEGGGEGLNVVRAIRIDERIR